MSGSSLFDFAVVTIFAREVLEGAIIIGEYRTIIIRGDSLRQDITKNEALREVTLSALFATAFALLVIAAIAIPLAVLSTNFEVTTAKIIEGASKVVAAISLLQLSLKLPKWLGVYGSCKKHRRRRRKSDENSAEEEAPKRKCLCLPLGKETEGEEGERQDGLSRREIRFNVAWNIWREVAECGVFLIPFFLSGEGIIAIPLSALIGCIVGLILGLGIYYANHKLENRTGLAVFAVLLLVTLSAGLFTGGCHNLEMVIGSTQQVWVINGDFWSVNRLPMTVFKPFGYNDSRTVLEIVCYWSWLLLSGLLHLRKYRMASKITQAEESEIPVEGGSIHSERSSLEAETVGMGDSSLEEGSLPPSSVRDDVLNGDVEAMQT